MASGCQGQESFLLEGMETLEHSHGTITRLAVGRAMRVRALGVQHCRAILCEKAVRAVIVKQPSRLQQIEGPAET